MAECPSDVLDRLHANDASAWKEAFQALYPIAWRGCGHARWNLPAEDREEAAADALAEVARRIHELETWPQVAALVFVIARRKAVSRLRAMLAQKRRSSAGPDLDLSEVAEVHLDGTDTASLDNWGELAGTMEPLLQKLGEPASVIVRGYTLEGLSYEELASRHRLPIGTVGVIIYRALHRLRKEVSASPKLMKELSLYLRLFMVA